MTLPQFKRINFESYRPGKSKLSTNKKIIKLSANESALGMSPKVKKEIFKKSNFFRYPDSGSTRLRMEISKKFKCDPKKIICGSGSDEIIQIICQLFLKSKDEVIVPRYSFLMYRIYSKIVGAKIKYAKEKNYKISIQEILKNVSNKTKIVFLANPNNPTGTYLKKEEILKLRKRLRSNILLVIDDAYDEYVRKKNYKSGLNIFKKSTNVIVLRTFSKIYGLAALRIGWGYGPKKIIEAMNMIKPPFNVSTVAQTAAILSLKDKYFIKKSVKHNLFWANKIKKKLTECNISTNDITTNFFLLNFDQCKYSADYTKKKLENNNIVVRSMKAYKIKNALRLTIGNSNDNNKLIKVINKIFKK
ncbi:histidinol-phosphate transaminase [Candidatus Pelagibacter sp.]|nr:histidinol-phosphate transaminase [Candidatus Pelagibacter sp.]